MFYNHKTSNHSQVAPFAGVWIEILLMEGSKPLELVAPFAGVWIEIQNGMGRAVSLHSSHPSRVCGLK